MESTRVERSGWPCGSSPRCATLAAVNSIAEAFGQAATQAPHPIQAAASIARSASGLGTGSVFASGALPVETEIKPPAWMIRSNAPRSTIRSLITGNACARHGSSVSVIAVAEVPHMQLADGRGALRPVSDAIDHQAAHPTDALAAIVVEGDRLLAPLDQLAR